MSSKKLQWPTNIESYELIEEIGRGKNSVVHHARCIPLNKDCAVKIYDLEDPSFNNDIEKLSKEIKVLVQCVHPNIVEFYTSFVQYTNLYAVTRYLEGGSVYHLMKYKYANGLEDEPSIYVVLKQVLKGLVYFHSNGMTHRDIRASNILIDKSGVVQISDFGLAGFFDGFQKCKTFAGSFFWMAPEVLEQVHEYDQRADIWSFGITAIEIATGKAPLEGKDPVGVLYETLRKPPPKLVTDKKFSESFYDMIDCCLKKDPKQRPTAAQLLKHKFFAQPKFQKLETLNPAYMSLLIPLSQRVKIVKKKEDRRANKMMRGNKKIENQQDDSNDNSESLSPEPTDTTPLPKGWIFDKEDALKIESVGEIVSPVRETEIKDEETQIDDDTSDSEDEINISMVDLKSLCDVESDDVTTTPAITIIQNPPSTVITNKEAPHSAPDTTNSLSTIPIEEQTNSNPTSQNPPALATTLTQKPTRTLELDESTTSSSDSESKSVPKQTEQKGRFLVSNVMTPKQGVTSTTPSSAAGGAPSLLSPTSAQTGAPNAVATDTFIPSPQSNTAQQPAASNNFLSTSSQNQPPKTPSGQAKPTPSFNIPTTTTTPALATTTSSIPVPASTSAAQTATAAVMNQNTPGTTTITTTTRQITINPLINVAPSPISPAAAQQTTSNQPQIVLHAPTTNAPTVVQPSVAVPQQATSQVPQQQQPQNPTITTNAPSAVPKPQQQAPVQQTQQPQSAPVVATQTQQPQTAPVVQTQQAATAPKIQPPVGVVNTNQTAPSTTIPQQQPAPTQKVIINPQVPIVSQNNPIPAQTQQQISPPAQTSTPISPQNPQTAPKVGTATQNPSTAPLSNVNSSPQAQNVPPKPAPQVQNAPPTVTTQTQQPQTIKQPVTDASHPVPTIQTNQNLNPMSPPPLLSPQHVTIQQAAAQNVHAPVSSIQTSNLQPHPTIVPPVAGSLWTPGGVNSTPATTPMHEKVASVVPIPQITTNPQQQQAATMLQTQTSPNNSQPNTQQTLTASGATTGVFTVDRFTVKTQNAKLQSPRTPDKDSLEKEQQQLLELQQQQQVQMQQQQQQQEQMNLHHSNSSNSVDRSENEDEDEEHEDSESKKKLNGKKDKESEEEEKVSEKDTLDKKRRRKLAEKSGRSDDKKKLIEDNEIIKKQINMLTQQSAKQMKLLNAIFTMNKESLFGIEQNAPYSTTQHKETIQLVGTLQARIRKLLEDNIALREENVRLKDENDKIKSDKHAALKKKFRMNAEQQQAADDENSS